MRIYQIAICDDEPVIRAQVKDILSSHPQADAFSIMEFCSCEELLSALRTGRVFDLIILDIEFPGINGIEMGRFLRESLRDMLTQILYVSSKEGYEKSLFDSRPLNFLTKPVDPEKLNRCMDTAIELIGKDGPCHTFVSNKVTYRIQYRNIVYFESYHKQIVIHTPERKYTYYAKLQELELPRYFFQTHQSFIVNYNYVEVAKSDRMILSDGTEIPVSRKYYRSVREYLSNQWPG